MASLVYNAFKAGCMDYTTGVDLDTDTVKMILCMTNTTAQTDPDKDFIGDLTTLDEFDGSGYTSGFGNAGRKTLAGAVVTSDDANNEGKFDGDDVTWTSLGAGTRSIDGVLLVEEITNDAASKIICYVEFTTPIVANGGDVTISWHADGILNLA